MTEKEFIPNDDINKVGGKSKPVGMLISAVLLLLVVLVIYIFISSSIAARTGEQASGTRFNATAAGVGGCCGSGSAAAAGTEPLTKAALAFYSESGGDTAGIQAAVDDYGCHQEVSLIRDGELVKRYSFAGSSIVDITP